MSDMDKKNNGYEGPERVFSGVQPTGSLHLGNYLGALKKFVDLQDAHDCLYCIVDLHAITVWQDPKELASQTRHIAAAFLAAGVDPSKAIIYAQSGVRAHSELAWYLNCVARIGWLNRMTQFKDKAGKNSEKMSVGLYDYPVLQAADILAFKDGTKKMSKSDPSDMARINLTDDADKIAKKIRKSKTDALPFPDDIDGLEGRPDVANLVGIYAALSGKSDAEVIAQYAGGQFGPFKSDLADVAVAKLSPITDLMSRYLADPDELDRILANGADRANEISEPIVSEVRDIIGFWRKGL